MSSPRLSAAEAAPTATKKPAGATGLAPLVARARLAGLHPLVAASYFLWALAITYPVVLHPRTTVIWVEAMGMDLPEKLWDLWWLHHALVDLHTSPFFTTAMRFPRGESLALQPFGLPAALLSVPLQPLLGLVLTYNLLTWLALAGSGFTLYLLVYDRVGRKGPAYAAGLFLPLAPVLGEWLQRGTFELINAQWLPLYLLFLLRGLERGRWRDLVGCGVSLALVAYTAWYFAVLAAVMTVLVLGWQGIRWIRTNRKPVPLRWTLGLGLGGLLVAPYAALAARQLVSSPGAGGRPDEAVRAAADLLDLINGPTPGLVLLIVGLLGLLAWRRALPWLVLAAGAFLFSLGPSLKVGGQEVGVPLVPYQFWFSLPFFSANRKPNLFGFLLVIFLAVAAGFGLARLAGNRKPWRWAVPATAVLVLFASLVQVPRPVTAMTVNPFYQALAADPEPGAVVEYPFRDRWLRYQMGPATVHGRPILGGFVSRRENAFPFVDDGASTRVSVFLQEPPPARDILTPDDPGAVFDIMGIRYLVAHPGLMTADERANLERVVAWLGARSMYADEEVLAYRLPSRPEVAAALDVGPGRWYQPESAPNWMVWRWTGGDASLRLVARASGRFRLHLTMYTIEAPKRVEVSANGVVLRTITVDQPDRKPPDYQVDLDVQAGENFIRLRTLDPPARPPGEVRDLAVAVGQVSLEALGP